MECNELAVQFISAFSRQIDILANWAYPTLGVTLGSILPLGTRRQKFQLRTNLKNQGGNICSIARFTYLFLPSLLIFFSLIAYYLCNNAFTQALPDICSYDFIFSKMMLRKSSEMYSASLCLMRMQYVLFVLAIVIFSLEILLQLRIAFRRNEASYARK